MSENNKNVSLATTVGKIKLCCCIYNGSGPRSGTAEALHKVALSNGTGAILSKSATLIAQDGNPLPRTHHAPSGVASFNSEGLPNKGIDYYIDPETIQEVMQGVSDTARKPYIVSLSGKTLDDNLEMIRRIFNVNSSNAKQQQQQYLIDGIELNLACPNIIGKSIIGYDFEQMEHILQAVKKEFSKQQPKSLVDAISFGIKLPPYLDMQHFKIAADIVNKYDDVVNYVTTINTLGYALPIDTTSDSACITANNGFAGLSGPAVHYSALANVRKLRQLLHSDTIDIVGVGGIASGQDAYNMLLAGASACQIATAHWREGPGCFERIANELRQIMADKGYPDLSHVKGKLQPWSKEAAAKARQQAPKKDNDQTNSGASKSSFMNKDGNDRDLMIYKGLSMVLALIVAVLCADKFLS